MTNLHILEGGVKNVLKKTFSAQNLNPMSNKEFSFRRLLIFINICLFILSIVDMSLNFANVKKPFGWENSLGIIGVGLPMCMWFVDNKLNKQNTVCLDR